MEPRPIVRRRSGRLQGLTLAGVLLGVFLSLTALTRLLCVDAAGHSSIWPPNGAILVGMLLLRKQARWLCLGVTFLISLSLDTPLSHAIVMSGLNFGLCGAVALGMRRWCGAALDLTQPRRMLTFMALALLAAAAEATCGELSISHLGAFDLELWLQWTSGDAMGLMLATPPLLILIRLDRYPSHVRAAPADGWLLPLACIGVVLATAIFPRSPLVFALYPLMLWTAFRSGPVRLLATLLAIAMVLTALTTRGYGALAALGSSQPLLRQIMIQPFLASLILCTLLPSSKLKEKRRMLERMSRLHQAAKAARHEALAANAAKSDFLANMSHEIRTPLNGVVAVADLLARSDLPEREREMAEIIRSSGDTLQRLLSDILDMARIESGKVTLETAPFHAGDMVRAVAGLSRLRCDEKGVALKLEIAPEIDEVVVGDMVRVRQVVTNLLSNAVKFTEAGEVRLTAERLQDGRARFSVQDTGVGFDMADKAKVLGRFEQADSSITRRFGGTGLGLSICASLTGLMGGALDCSSTPGEGALFWLELPLEPVRTPLELVTPAPAPEPAAEPAEALPRVLVVDDHPINRQVVKLMLDGMADLTCLEDGAQAVEFLQSQTFDVILMDMQMPVMDGLSATRLIREREQAEGSTRTPIVMLTANALPEHMASALAAGADLHLAKPFTSESLFLALDSVLSPPELPSAVAA